MRECMKKHLKLLPLLITIIVGSFTFANSLFFSANATYIEGDIIRDTVWTLTDSPFIVSKDVTIYSNATLTIEPGVEIRFGGNFRLIVNGRLIANGTQDRMITFTSNKDQPGAGDWKTIAISNKTMQSTLAYCFMEYAKNGTTIENGNVEIKNCEISNNQNGIHITGDNQATIQNNTIRSNADGIILTGNSTSGVSFGKQQGISRFRPSKHIHH